MILLSGRLRPKAPAQDLCAEVALKRSVAAWRLLARGSGEAPLGVLELSDRALAVSGSLGQSVEIEGRRYGHVLDPRSGRPVEHSLVSVTVVGDDPATAAAWATALLCLGPEAASEAAERERLSALLWSAHEGEEPTLEQSPAFASEWSALLDEPRSR